MTESHHFKPPDEAKVITAEIYVLSYIKEDGTQGYGVATHGDVPMTSFLGLTVLAQQDILSWRNDDA